MRHGTALAVTATALLIAVALAYTVLPRAFGLAGAALGFYIDFLTMFMVVAAAVLMFGVVYMHINEDRAITELLTQLVFYRLEEKVGMDKALSERIERLSEDAKFQIAKELGMAREIKPRRLTLNLSLRPRGIGLARGRRRGGDDIEWI